LPIITGQLKKGRQQMSVIKRGLQLQLQGKKGLAAEAEVLRVAEEVVGEAPEGGVEL
jgi:hypothetical protein